jgi:hypothetical protein
MWLVHEAAEPSAVAGRVGIDVNTFGMWKGKLGEWVVAWLYGEETPAGSPDDFRPTRHMLDFRQEASISAIARAATRQLDEIPASQLSRYGREVSMRLITTWRKEYRHLPWFEGWLLRGESPPPHLAIATVNQIRRGRTAWDYIELCRQATSPISAENTYVTEWIGGGKIPDVGWLLWLYGAPPPEGVFVVYPQLQRLRREMTSHRISVAAGVDWASVRKWNQSERLRPAFEDALRTAEKTGGQIRAGWSAKWPDLHPSSADRMWEYASHAALRACCKRAGLITQDYYQWRAEAEKCGARELFDQYIAFEGPFQRTKQRLVGPVAANFFIASEAMMAFRAAAAEEMKRQAVWSLKELPGFLDWFCDWASPGLRYGRRTVPRSVAALAGEGNPPAGPTPGNEGGRAAEDSPARFEAGADTRGVERTPSALLASATPPSPRAPEVRERPAREKHVKWKQWKDEGLSYNQIVQRHKDETGEDITRDAVIQALRRL